MANNLHHALLFTGNNINTQRLALDFAQKELCFLPQLKPFTLSTPTQSALSNDSCNNCQSCKLFLAKSHPDFFCIDEAENTIKIDNVRNLIEFVGARQQISHKKMAIITHANKLTVQASNALLKTLEEPISNTTIILITKTKQELLATIVSRCLEVKISAVIIENFYKDLSNTEVSTEVSTVSTTLTTNYRTSFALLQDCQITNTIMQDLVNLILLRTNMIELAEQWNGAFKPLECSNAIYNVIYFVLLAKNNLLPRKLQDKLHISIKCHDENNLNYASKHNANINVDANSNANANANVNADSNDSLLSKLSLLSNYVSKYQSFTLLDSVISFKRQLKLGYNPNLQMFLERLLLRFFAN